jgi:hypothetical protein
MVAVARRIGYRYGMSRGCTSFLALLAVFAAPVTTSTRFFCHYTGEEIVGCAESRVPQHAQFRGEQCCQQRTFRALDGVRLVEEQPPQAPASVATVPAPVLRDASVTIAVRPAEGRAVASAGPPAFLSHRALLI